MATDDPQLPRAPEAEKNVVASILLLPEIMRDVSAIVRPHDFFEPPERTVFGVMFDLHQAALPIEPAMIRDRLRDAPKSTGDSWGAYLLEIAQQVATAAHATHYAKQIIEASRKRRLLSIAETAVEAAQNGQPAKSVFDSLSADIDDFRREAEAIDRQPRNKFEFADLRDEFPRLNAPVIDGLMRQGETCNIIAQSKAGKSWLAYYILLCIITGRDVFNQFATSSGRCLLIDNELHKPTLAHRIPAVANAMMIPAEHYESDLQVWTLRGNLRTMAELAAELEQIEPGTYQAILFDAKYRFLPAATSENDNAAETHLYNLLDQIAERTQAALLLIHHGSKGSQSEKRITDVGAGAGAQSRAADCHLILREHELPDVVVFDAALRSFAPIEPMALQWQFPLWVPVAGVDTAKLKGKQSRSEERQSERDHEGVAQIAKALRDEPATARQLRRQTGIGPDRQQRLLDWMESQGQVTATETKIKGNPCRVYRLTKTED